MYYKLDKKVKSASTLINIQYDELISKAIDKLIEEYSTDPCSLYALHIHLIDNMPNYNFYVDQDKYDEINCEEIFEFYKNNIMDEDDIRTCEALIIGLTCSLIQQILDEKDRKKFIEHCERLFDIETFLEQYLPEFCTPLYCKLLERIISLNNTKLSYNIIYFHYCKNFQNWDDDILKLIDILINNSKFRKISYILHEMLIYIESYYASHIVYICEDIYTNITKKIDEDISNSTYQYEIKNNLIYLLYKIINKLEPLLQDEDPYILDHIDEEKYAEDIVRELKEKYYTYSKPKTLFGKCIFYLRKNKIKPKNIPRDIRINFF